MSNVNFSLESRKQFLCTQKIHHYVFVYKFVFPYLQKCKLISQHKDVSKDYFKCNNMKLFLKLVFIIFRITSLFAFVDNNASVHIDADEIEDMLDVIINVTN